MIKFDSVTKFYKTQNGKKFILKDSSFIIHDHVNLAILGRNGAGKSTLIKLIASAEKPNKGRIQRDNRISFPMALSSFFISSLSARQNVIFITRMYGYNINKTTEYVENFCELGEYFDMPIKTFSSGMRARLSFGLSLAFEFETYLIDEVTAVGDASFRKKAQSEFSKRISTASIILVSHNNDIIRETCDSALLLENGKVYLYDDIEEAINQYNRVLKIDSDIEKEHNNA